MIPSNRILTAPTGILAFYGPALIPSFSEFEPFVNRTYKYFNDLLIEEPSLPYKMKVPLYWTDEFVNWEEMTKEKTSDVTNGFVSTKEPRQDESSVGI